MEKPPPQASLPTLDTTLLNYPHAELTFSCSLCRRGGVSQVSACAARFGRTVSLGELLYRFVRRCPNSPYDQSRRKPQKYGRRCGARIEETDQSVEPYIPAMLVLEIEERIRRKRYMGW